ncbi:MAG: Gfo/Idh/MocA family oxidoreductase [Caldilineaceae bacterium]|nr:Gfo/Idh/MocA family oxidoreductase [Caldilineaceae bacterium]
MNHPHIYGQTQLLLNAGAQLVSYYAPEADLQQQFGKAYPAAKLARSEAEILEDPSIDLIASAAIPNERSGVGVRAMQHGKDFLSDKPGFTTLEQVATARKVQAETRRIYAIDYGERLENRATTKALELVQAGAIGEVINTVGLGPHRARYETRPPWFFVREKFGGILIDIASHQIDQFLYFTQAVEVEIAAATVANYHHPQYPEFEDFGEMLLRTPKSTGYVRVDWFTPEGLDTWGDTRLTVIGTEGYLEVRKNIDVAGRPGGDHLFLVNQEKTEYIDCKEVELPFGRQLLDDIRNRTQTAIPQEHVFRVMELALQAQAKAARVGHLQGS